MPNRLAQEDSLYLRQHADNPVDWWPWCPEAFAKAREQDKPVLISIGYSSCHWCHVMAHECFENDYIAGLMNQHFVCIKVDREERPDVDAFYMEAVQMLTQHGGWPLNAFALPDGRPFFGGTYFPPKDSGHGIVPWPQVLMRVADFYKRSKDELIENAESIVSNIQHLNQAGGADGQSLQNQQLLTAAAAITHSADDEYGGFGGAPKFPPSMMLNFLLDLRYSHAIEHQVDLQVEIDKVVPKALTAMARGGIFDQLGGGFSRYSVDRHWLVPHFEKMLYDNGLLIDTYVKGWLRYEQPLFVHAVAETIGWLFREMQHPGGPFYASLDADSEGEEGKFYVWTPNEIKEVLGEEEGQKFCEAYDVTEEGNFEHDRTVLALHQLDLKLREDLAPARTKLLEWREKTRTRPARDEKILLSWNALTIRGLAEAGFYLAQPSWFEAARTAADWLWDHLQISAGEFASVYYPDGSGARHRANLSDYAFYAEALLSIASKSDIFEPGSSEEYVERAQLLADSALQRFSDASGAPGFFFTDAEHNDLGARKKDWFDNAIPSGNSSMVHVLACLHALTGESRYRDALDNLRQGYPAYAERAPNGVAHALAGFTEDAVGIGVLKLKEVGAEKIDELIEGLRDRAWRRLFIQRLDKDPEAPKGMQLCIGTQCMKPMMSVRAVLNKF